MTELKEKLRANTRRHTVPHSPVKSSLRRLYGAQSDVKRFPDDSFSRAARGIHELVKGEYINTAYGDVFVARVEHPREHHHGDTALASLASVSDDLLSRWARFPKPKQFNYRQTIFMDTETSGLASGSGTIPFLIGLGYYHGDHFRVQQFFADSPAVEEGMLDLVVDFVQSFDTLVTFNGKCFDVPQIETRYILKRRSSPFARMNHIDLLYPSRQLWSGEFIDCKLQTLERQVLGFHREDDLPGSEVPEAYYRFLHHGDPDPLYRVFQHNADDITSLASLTYHLWNSLRSTGNKVHPKRALARGKVFGRLGEEEKSMASYSAAMEAPPSAVEWAHAAMALSMIHKRRKEWTEATRLWRWMIDRMDRFHLLPYVELAKYLEHKRHQLVEAEAIVEDALNRLPAYRIVECEALEYRLARIRRKLEKQEESTG